MQEELWGGALLLSGLVYIQVQSLAWTPSHRGLQRGALEATADAKLNRLPIVADM